MAFPAPRTCWRYEVLDPAGGVDPALHAASRAAVFGDVDDDGGIDVLVVNRDGPVHLLHNVVPDRGHWITLRVLDERGRDAIGATVTLTAGGRTFTVDVRPAYSYLASNDPRIHSGLGDAEAVTDIRVRWLDGTLESFGDRPANQIHRLQKGEGTRVDRTEP